MIEISPKILAAGLKIVKENTLLKKIRGTLFSKPVTF
jgi:hypothetical protein